MGSIINFIKESLTELRDNVKWTPRSELLNLSGLVIVFSVLFSLVIWAADSVLSRIVNLYFDIIS
jgi:preprotein translocase subunit SecE